MRSVISPQPWPPAGVKPYYCDDAVCILLGDCREIVPTLGRFDLLLTDPPYGLGDKWTGGGTWQHHAGLYAQAKMWDQEDPSLSYTMTQSAPLMVPTNIDNSFHIVAHDGL